MNAKFQKLYELALHDLTENILPWWMTYGVDEVHGGFYGEVDNNNVPNPNAPKHITLSARLIWTFSSAYRILGNPEYKAMADRAYDYFVKHFWDADHNMCYTLLSAEGEPIDKTRHVYGNAFAIYGFSEYYRATGCEEALDYARKLEAAMEKNAYDPEFKGYYEALTEKCVYSPWLRGVNRLPTDVKTMNTHLHVIEAYTCFLRSVDEPKVRNVVRQQLYVMLNKIVDHDTHHYNVYLDRAWNPTSTEISYGHDIEGSWLMWETAEVLDEPEAKRYTRDICVNIARACLEQGFTDFGAMKTEYDPVTGHESKSFSWWEQNEAVVGFLNAWELSGEEAFLDASLRCMEFNQTYFVDHDKGGWFAHIDPATLKVTSPIKLNGWTCPYHNSRMCMEVIERYRKHAEAEK